VGTFKFISKKKYFIKSPLIKNVATKKRMNGFFWNQSKIEIKKKHDLVGFPFNLISLSPVFRTLTCSPMMDASLCS
jgi:hypothetical protein